MDFKESSLKYLSLCEESIKQAFKTLEKVPEPLFSAMKYSVNAGGKRLRPTLMFSCADMFKGRIEKVMPFAAAIEFIHTYSLIHDDLPCMDDDDYRRGRLTCHKVFGEGMAVLTGDALLNAAYEIMFTHIAEENTFYNVAAAAEITYAAGCMGMVAGQSLDLCNEGNDLAGEKELLYIHKHKTGKMIRASLTAGAYIAQADESEIKKIGEIGEELGILFQITDDILDVTGSLSELGKSTGKDEAEKKLTYIKLFGMEKSKALAAESAERITAKLDELSGNSTFLQQITLKMLNRNK